MDGGFEIIARLRSRLGAGVEIVAVQGDQPLLLDDPDSCYVTLAEQHQLFCVGYGEGRPVGRRRHLAPCEPGQPVFGLRPPSGSSGTGLLLSGVTGSSVWRVRHAALRAGLADAEGRSLYAWLVERWATLLIATLPPAARPGRFRPLARGAQTIEQEDLPLTAADDDLLWIEPAGRVHIYQGIALSDYGHHAACWPISRAVWARCGAGRLGVVSTAELLLRPDAAHVLAEFSAFVVAVAARQRAQQFAEQLERERASHAAEHKQVASALFRLVQLGAAAPERAAELERERDPFVIACRRIFEWQKLAVPPRIEPPAGAALSDMLEALGRIGAVRTRPVQLDGEFWRSDAGPLLAFALDSAGTPHPVALLPRAGGGGYVRHDPRAPSPVALDQGNAADLHPQAHQFYRSFATGPIGALGLVRFSAHRLGRDIARVLWIGLAAGLLGTALPLLTGLVFDRIIPGAERGLLFQLMGVLVAAYASSWLFELARGFALVRAHTGMDSALEGGVWDRLLSLPLGFFRAHSAGDLAARVAGIGSIRERLAQAGLSSVLSGLFSLWNFVLLFLFDPRLALSATALVLLASTVAAFASYVQLGYDRRLVALDGRISGLLLQLFGGLSKLRVSSSEKRAFSVWAALFAQRRDADLASARVRLRVDVFHSVFPVLCSLTLFWLVSEREPMLSTGQFLAFSVAFGVLLRALIDLVNMCLRTLALIPLYERARPILSTPIESRGDGQSRVQLEGAVELSHVSFRYAPDVPPALDDVVLRIEPGEFVAIVGPSGSGKSTLVRLLLGFDRPSEGAVFYDDKALNGMDLRALRRQIGVVLQHSSVMAGDIYSNIVGNGIRPIEDAWRAARQAAIDRDIEAMPMGMHTLLSQGGASLSGGQRQRLLIARALASSPKILILDEATSALDNQTQASVIASLEQLHATRIVIAHRLSTIRHADRIVVLERGRIVQQGRFEQLIESEGTFRRLALRQLL